MIRSPAADNFIKSNPDFTPDDFSRVLIQAGFIDFSDKKIYEGNYDNELYKSKHLTNKHNAYKIVDMRTDKELDTLLVIDEYFGNLEAEKCGTHEINAYIS